jgi:hypothetical protein
MHAARHLDAWLCWARRSKLKPVKLARTVRLYRAGSLAAIHLDGAWFAVLGGVRFAREQ